MHEKRNARIRQAVRRARREEGHAYAWGGGSIVAIILIIILLLIIF